MSRVVLLALVLLLALGNAYVYVELFISPSVRVIPLRLAKGGATLVELPEGHTLLLDAGADASVVRALGQVLPPWQRRLDALVLFSSAGGSTGGAPFVLERYRVGTLLRSSEQGALGREAALAAAASAAHTRIQIIPPKAGLVLHYRSFSLPLSSMAPAGIYQVTR